MEFLVPLFAFANPLAPIVALLHAALEGVNSVFHNYGWSLIVLALLVKAAFWPLNSFQFKQMTKMQALSPKIRALQQRYKNDRERLNAEMMALYKEAGANPAAGCLPLLLQMPILIALYQAVISDAKSFAQGSWLWIGSEFARNSPGHMLAANLGAPDYALLAVYIVTMYLSIRFTSPATDPQQAQQQKIMAVISPAMIGYLGFKYAWPSALILYWLSFNVFTIAQQLYLIRRYHTNPAGIGPHPEETPEPAALQPARASAGSGSTSKNGSAKPGGGSRAARRRRSSRR